MAEQRTKSNKKFMLLSAIGIVMVADQHTFTAFNIFGKFLPYNSFFMPMFVFISGYFNKVNSDTRLSSYVGKKIRSLLVPYAGLSMTVFFLQQLINIIKTGGHADPLPPGYLTYVAGRIVTVGTYGAIVEPMWFVISLFSTLMIYAVLKKCFSRIWNSYIMFAVFIAMHLFAVYIAKNTAQDAITNYLLPLKCMFFLPFLELGSIYKKSIEKRHEALSAGAKLGLMSLLLLVNVIRTLYLPDAYDVAFDSIDCMSGFTSPYIVTPLISSVIGILFWITFVDLCGKQVAESRFVNYLSCNTFWVMGLHVLFYNILNCILMAVDHIVKLPYFDVETFKGSEWYFWGIGDNIKVVYVFFGVLGALGLKYMYDKIWAALGRKTKKAGFIVPVVTACVLAVGIFIVVSVINSKAEAAGNGSETVTEPGIDDNGTPIDPADSGDETVNDAPVLAYACVEIVYDNGGTPGNYYSDFVPVYSDGSYIVKLKRTDEGMVPAVFDGLSYLSIKLLHESEENHISAAEIGDIGVLCNGTQINVVAGETDELGEGDRVALIDRFDAQGADEIEISFSVSGIE